MRQIGWALRESKSPHAGCDGPAAHEHDVPLFVHQADKLVRDRRNAGLIERSVLIGQYARADLDDDGPCTGSYFLSNGITHGIQTGRFNYACASTWISSPANSSFDRSKN